MRNLYIIFFLILSGCVSTSSKSLFSQNCTELGNIAAAAAASKWAARDPKISKEDREQLDWRFLAVVYYEQLESLGLTKPEIDSFVKDIYFIDLFPSMGNDIISHHYYTKKKCALEGNNQQTKPLKELQTPILSCWMLPQVLTIEPEQCIYEEVAVK